MKLWLENCGLEMALEEAKNGFLDFEFYLDSKKILLLVEEFGPWIEYEGSKVWFSGKIDKKTGYVVEAKVGRQDWQQNEFDDDIGDVQYD
jgi:hypothetical protein